MAGERVALVAHLGDDVVGARRLHELAHLPHGAGEGLLGVHVLAQLHGLDRGQRVPVVGGRHEDRVEGLARLVVHLAVVRERPDVGQELLRLGDAARVDVRHRHDPAQVAEAPDVATALPADADDREADAVAGRRLAAAGDQPPRHDGDAAGGGGAPGSDGGWT